MTIVNTVARMPVLCIPHGGGPLPLLGDPSHKSLTNWLIAAGKSLPKPEAILTISAHWEVTVDEFRATSCTRVPLDHWLYGFVLRYVSGTAPNSY